MCAAFGGGSWSIRKTNVLGRSKSVRAVSCTCAAAPLQKILAFEMQSAWRNQRLGSPENAVRMLRQFRLHALARTAGDPAWARSGLEPRRSAAICGGGSAGADRGGAEGVGGVGGAVIASAAKQSRGFVVALRPWIALSLTLLAMTAMTLRHGSTDRYRAGCRSSRLSRQPLTRDETMFFDS